MIRLLTDVLIAGLDVIVSDALQAFLGEGDVK
jgi:hypothetical protein